jgi:hypothetical protein
MAFQKRMVRDWPRGVVVVRIVHDGVFSMRFWCQSQLGRPLIVLIYNAHILEMLPNRLSASSARYRRREASPAVEVPQIPESLWLASDLCLPPLCPPTGWVPRQRHPY